MDNKSSFFIKSANLAAQRLQKQQLSRVAAIDKEAHAEEIKQSRASSLVFDDTNGPVSTLFPTRSPGRGDIMGKHELSYEQHLSRFSQFLWVNICVTAIADAANQIGIRIIDTKRQNVPNNTAKGTARGLKTLLNNPNPYTSKSDFFEILVYHLLLTGNAFVEKAEAIDGVRPKELYILNPKNMVVIPDRKNFVAGYLYVVNNKKIRYSPNEIIHIKLPDPRGESHYGLSRLAAARSTLTMESDAIEWNIAYFNNATWPSGIIVSKEGMGKQEFRRAKSQLRQNYQGKSKVGTVMLLEGGLDWKQTTPDPKDLDFLNLRRAMRTEILSLFKVPPAVAGVFEFENTTSRSGGIREQSLFFWSNGVQPIFNRILDKFNTDLAKGFGDNFKLVGDLTRIPALRETEEMKKNKSETYKNLVSSGWTIEQAKQEVYPDLDTFPQGDNLLISTSSVFIPVDQAGESSQPVKQPQPPNSKKPKKENIPKQ